MRRRVSGRIVRATSLSIAAAFAGGALAASALAQTTPATPIPATVLDPVSIDATRTARPVSQVPGSVSVVEGEQIDRQQPNHWGDLIRSLPSVELSGGPRSSGIQPNIRGLEGERVQIRIDGARQDFQNEHKGRVFVDPDMLKRVEVVRGPQSTLYGSGAIAGLLSFTTKDAADFLQPGQNWGFRVKAGYQSAPDMGMGSFTGFARAGMFDVVASGLYRNGSDIRQGGGTTLPFSALDVMSGLIKVGARVAPDARVSFSWLGHRDTGYSTTSPNTASTTSPADRSNLQHTFAANFSYNPAKNPWFDFRGTIYHTRLDVHERRFSDSRVDGSFFRTTGIDFANSNNFAVNDWMGVRLTYGIDGYIQYVSGTRNSLPRTQYPNAHGDAFGLFAQSELKFFDIVTLTPGGRFDRFSRRPENSALGPDLEASRFSPRVSVAVEPVKWLNVYGLYAEAFRAPALNELYVSGSHFPGNLFIPNPNLRPETARNREVGVNFKFDDLLTKNDRLRARLVYFNTNYDDFIDSIVTFTTTTNVNRSRANISGFEAEIAYAGFGFFGSIAASRIRGDQTSPTNTPLSSIPGDKLGLTAGYTHEPWGVTFGGRAKFVADQNRVPTGTSATPGYSLFDLFVSWEPVTGPLAGVRMDFGIDNITDRRYRDHLSAVGDYGRNFKFTTAFQF
ncbi:MAG: TonB-dependent hemoglobin/transferrin/lactoferrin family receptor [Alphaproteobacteria bacterium]|nr:TonB-dependent hemoglobin/transferrin/lactoferrin family receptor [Alphaproteobacteria bacterium]MCW5740845.1 TonB-dependent hemoglobin/transferrin/lactoferrin family receptor [Alphaproteobacteria bacterium]